MGGFFGSLGSIPKHANSHLAQGSDEIFDQNLSTSDSPSFNKLTIQPDQQNSSVSLGSLEFQSYALNNGWIADNAYYNGSNFVRREQGSACLFYFQGNEGQFRVADNNDAGTSIPSTPSFKVGSGGKISAGGNVSNIGDFEVGMFFCNGDNFGFSDKTEPTKKAIIDVSVISENTSVTISFPDKSGTILLDTLLRTSATAPTTTTASGIAGEIRADSDYIYICTATDTWKRTSVTGW